MNSWNLEDKDDFFNRLGIKDETVLKALVSEENKKKVYKDAIKIPKKNGERIVYNIDKLSGLYQIQNNLKRQYLDKIYISDVAYGFVKKRSYYDYMEPHLNRYVHKYYLRVDIKSFFDSINGEHINRAFAFILKECIDKEEILGYLQDILLYNGQLAQGTSIAPVVSNIVFRELDIRIEKYCIKRKVIYTRYADDMLFSSIDNTVVRSDFYRGISRIVESGGFSLNKDKTIRMKDELALNGTVVGETIHLSRKKLKPIRTVLFALDRCRKHINDAEMCLNVINSTLEKSRIDKKFNNATELLYYLLGYRSYLIQMLNYCSEENERNKMIKLIKKIETAVL